MGMFYLSLYIIRVLSRWSGHAHCSLFTFRGAKLRLFLVTAKYFGKFLNENMKNELFSRNQLK